MTRELRCGCRLCGCMCADHAPTGRNLRLRRAGDPCEHHEPKGEEDHHSENRTEGAAAASPSRASLDHDHRTESDRSH